MNHDNDGGRLETTLALIDQELRNIYAKNGRHPSVLDVFLSLDNDFGDEWVFPVCAQDTERYLDAYCDIYGDTPARQAQWLFDQLTEG